MSRQWSQWSSPLTVSHDLMSAQPTRANREGGKITSRAEIHEHNLQSLLSGGRKWF